MKRSCCCWQWKEIREEGKKEKGNKRKVLKKKKERKKRYKINGFGGCDSG